MVSDLRRSKEFYGEKLGCEVTDWWVIRDGFSGLALKLLQAESPEDVRPNKAGKGSQTACDLYCYTENWKGLDELHRDFTSKDVPIAVQPWIDEANGPWKEFVIKDPDGYQIAFGGTDGH
ncbi:VOC family protein [Bacillus salacetis]|uniref:VOC family protein n=1 Tax=Bacillus salacetis TaxID=2315464 RepID=A0A3A1QRP7_9BACI|nr:VOC family protein [Bacillus salacetis]RIW29615.1 VOC family protein [Bacillus salacetis]